MNALGIDIGGTAVKAAWIDERTGTRLSVSDPYKRPDRAQLSAAVFGAVRGLGLEPGGIRRVGLCVPGRRAPAGDRVDLAVNIPGLEGYPFGEIVRDAIEDAPDPVIVSDAEAATLDAAAAHPGSARILGITIGTGVGVCLLEDGKPVRMGRGSIGHLGQIDVGPIGSWHPIGPDGGRGSLEAYLGVAAFRDRLGDRFPEHLPSLPIDDPGMVALVRAMRIALAIYTPDLVLLLGGIGMALSPRAGLLSESVCRELTSVARPGWRLAFGQSRHHAAMGAARMSMMRP